MARVTEISQATQETVARVFAALDYQRLGAIYCDEGGDAFWAAHREPARELGLKWAGALLERLPTGGCSLYVGAGVAELPAMIVENLELDRSLRACNLDAEECQILTSALQGSDVDLRIEAVDAVAVDAPCDHLSLVSVCNDPLRYPMVSGLSYGRLPPVQLDVAAFEAERAALRAMVHNLLAQLRRPGWVTTTFEEVAWVLDAAAELGVPVTADDVAVETAIVGDPIGFLSLR